MIKGARLAAATLATAISLGSLSAPALAAKSKHASTSKHWTAAQCKTWEQSFVKRNPHASKTRKAAANKVLKGQACTVRVK
jgi:hypothetical protein